MKRLRNGFWACLLSTAALTACSDMRYDISDGFNKELTFFEDEISVPVGSIGPVTIETILQNLSFGQMIQQILKINENGEIQVSTEGNIYAVNVYELEQKVGDVSQAFTFSPGDQSNGISGPTSLFNLIGFRCLEQKMEFTASNPLRDDVPFRTNLAIKGYNSDYEVSYQKEFPIETTLARRSNAPISLLSIDIPADVTDPVSEVALNGPELDLPAYPSSRIQDNTESDVFFFACKYSTKVGVSSKFRIPLAFTVKDANLPLGQFKLHQCDATIEMENTLPISVTLKSLKVLKDVEEMVVDENITISGDFTVAGGSLEKPGVSTVKLRIAAQEGTIPDIHGLRIELEANSQPGCENVALAPTQGLYIKSSSAKVSGGFTISIKK